MYIYGDRFSGNCYKLVLISALLDIDYQWVDVDILKGETRSDAFRAMNPNTKIPVVRLDNGEHLWESNAILNYLATGSRYLPEDRLELARVQQWQFFEQYSHEPYIAVARYIQRYLDMPQERLADYAATKAPGYKALGIMEQQLARSPFLAGESMTTADISLYAYTHVAQEGGFELEPYTGIREWLRRIEDQPGYVAMGWPR